MIPAPPPGVATRFSPPPTWAVPTGFDPRRGHLPDPTWPAAPEGWTFWVPDAEAGRERAQVPTASLPVPTGLVRGERRRLGITLGALAVLVVGVIWLASATGDDDGREAPGVGSCWAERSGGWLSEVPCGPGRADYVVVEVAATPEQCGLSTDGYVEIEGDILCLEPAG